MNRSCDNAPATTHLAGNEDDITSLGPFAVLLGDWVRDFNLA